MSTFYRSFSQKENSKETELQERLVKAPDLLEDGSIDPLKLKSFSYKKELFFQIEKGALFPNTFVDFSIFKQKRLAFLPFIEANTDSPFMIEDIHIEDIRGDHMCELAINKNELSTFRRYLNHCMESQGIDENIKALKKAVVLKENAKIVIQDIMSNPRSGENIKAMRDTVNKITDSIINDRDMIYNMLSLSKFDYYTYTHCLNVGVLSIGLGIALGVKGRELRQLGLGSMLHDIGKAAISPEILNKQGKLDEYEYKIMQQHVIEGAKMLSENPEFPKEAMNAVLQHHEKISGKGYPNRLRDKEISLFGKIVGIADCYDALTISRPYKGALTPFQALKIIAGEKSDYDGEMLKLFVKMLGKSWTKM